MKSSDIEAEGLGTPENMGQSSVTSSDTSESTRTLLDLTAPYADDTVDKSVGEKEIEDDPESNDDDPSGVEEIIQNQGEITRMVAEQSRQFQHQLKSMMTSVSDVVKNKKETVGRHVRIHLNFKQ